MRDDLTRRFLFFLLCAFAVLLVSMPAYAEELEPVEPEPDIIEELEPLVLEDVLPVLAVLGAALVGVGLTRGGR